MNNTIAVISRNQQEFDDFVKHWASVGSRSKFKRVSRLDHIRGVRFLGVCRVGEYWKLKGHEELYHLALTRIGM